MWILVCATGRDARAIDTHKEDGRKAGVLNRLSLQSQQARAELYHSLQHLSLQRERLRTSLKHHSAGTQSINKVGIRCVIYIIMLINISKPLIIMIIVL